MDIIIEDDMVKESRVWKAPMIILFVLAALFPLALIWKDIKTNEVIVGVASYMVLGCYFLYGYLYAYKYKVTVTNDKIILYK